MDLLIGFVVVVFIIVITGIINEKKLHMPYDIALVLVSFVGSIVLLAMIRLNLIQENGVVNFFQNFNLGNFLMDGILCFMLFAGASRLQFSKFISNFKSIGYLAIVSTFISAVMYGILFYGMMYVFQIPLGIWECILLGCIISPTDPIAATGILSKFGLSKSVTSVIEGESLFNDGIGVALFIFVRGILTRNGGENFFLLIGKEVLGAILIGFLVSFVLFQLLKMTKEPILHILISLLDVSISYILCEFFGFSGVIASVVCGMYFSYETKKCSRWKEVVDSKELYIDFWEIMNHLLNSTVFVLIGLSVLTIPYTKYTFLLIPIAIVLNLVTRAIGVGAASCLIGKNNIPSKYSLKEFVLLMSWCALKGGLSLAMAISTIEFLKPMQYDIVINVTMITILFTTIIQGLITSKVYRYIEEKREKRRGISLI